MTGCWCSCHEPSRHITATHLLETADARLQIGQETDKDSLEYVVGSVRDRLGEAPLKAAQSAAVPASPANVARAGKSVAGSPAARSGGLGRSSLPRRSHPPRVKRGTIITPDPVPMPPLDAYAWKGNAHSSRHSSLRMWLICWNLTINAQT